jgi:hypothetical protein
VTTSDGRPYAVAVMPWHVTEKDPPHPRTRVGAWISNHELFKALVADGWVVDVLTTAQAGTYMIDGVYVYPLAEATIQSRNDMVDVVFGPLEDKQRSYDFYADKTRARHRAASVQYVKLAHGHPKTWEMVGWPNLIVFNSQQLRAEAAATGLLYDPHVKNIVVPPVVWPRSRMEQTMGFNVLHANVNGKGKGGDLFFDLAEGMPHRQFLGIDGRAPASGVIRGAKIIGPQLSMDHVYRSTWINLMPSTQESYGRVAVEAATYGIPTIAHPTPGLIEALGPAGIFINRGNFDAWKREIDRLHVTEEWREANAMALCLADQLTPEEDLEMFVTTMKELLP